MKSIHPISPFADSTTTFPTSNSPISNSTNDKLILLGTGTPNGFPDRSGPSAAVIVEDTPYLIDCGPGVIRRASAAFHRSGITPLALPNLEHLFLTHLHSDHTIGLPDLMLTPWVLGRKNPLKVWGPKGTERMATHLLEAYRDDIDLRRTGPDGTESEGWKVEVTEIGLEATPHPASPHPSTIFPILQSDSLTVDAFPVSHGPWPAFGFRFTTPERTIVLSGDTRPTEIGRASCRERV